MVLRSDPLWARPSLMQTGFPEDGGRRLQSLPHDCLRVVLPVAPALAVPQVAAGEGSAGHGTSLCRQADEEGSERPPLKAPVCFLPPFCLFSLSTRWREGRGRVCLSIWLPQTDARSGLWIFTQVEGSSMGSDESYNFVYKGESCLLEP